MYGIIFKTNLKTIIAVCFLWATLNLNAQENEKYRSLKLVIGAGYGHYFNNFTNVLDQDVINNRPEFFGKLLWRPEHRLGIGIESGYYLMYSTTRIQTDNGSSKLTSSLKVVPIFLTLSMNVVKHLDLNFATGWTSMIYFININKSKTNKVVGQTYSMSNFALGITYSIPLSKKIDLGSEIKYLNIGKTNDHHLSASVCMSYKLFRRKVN